MTPEIVDDLKQFIQAAFVQYGAEISERLDGIDGRLDGIDGRLDGIDEQLGELQLMLNTNMDAVGEQFVTHDRRISKLEARAA